MDSLSQESLGTLTQEVGGARLSDELNAYNSNVWWKADGYGNGGLFNVGWRNSSAEFINGALVLSLNDSGCVGSCSNYPYASSEYRTRSIYGLGSFEVRMKAAKGSGLISSFFVYNEASHDEVDIEFLGKDTTKMQTNYINSDVGGHETWISLGFDAAEDYHTYRFEWDTNRIEWFVDGVKVHGEYGARGPLPTQGGKIMMNLWTGRGIDSWTGSLNYTAPVTASYEWVKWTSL